MNKVVLILSIILISACATVKPPATKIEYNGPPLQYSTDYSISQLSPSSTIFTIGSSYEENILVNLYEPEGKLGITLYKGTGGVMALSLAMVLDKFDYQLKLGQNKIVLFGEKGKAELNLTVQ